MGSPPILSLTDVPAKSAEGPAAEASLHVLTLYHQCNGPVSLMWEEEQGQISGCHAVTHGGSVQVALEKHLKGALLPLPREGKLI